ncbi:TRAP transporter substrate-binding protein DctP, partial [Chloroflexota bacterium]
RYATHNPFTHPTSELYQKPLMAELTKRTDGRLQFETFWSGTLGKAELFNAFKSGLAHMGYVTATWVPGKFPLCDIGGLPFSAADPLNAAKALNQLYDEGYFDEEWGEVQVLTFLAGAPYSFMMRDSKPMTFEELSGLKARTPGGTMTETLKAFGMIPVALVAGETYEAYEKGLIDVCTWAPKNFLGWKIYEASTRAFLQMEFQFLANQVAVFNKDKLASLPPDIQKIILDTSREYAAAFLGSFTQSEAEFFEKCKEYDIEVYTLPDPEMAKVKAATLGIWDNYVEDMEAKELPIQPLMKRFLEIMRELGEDPPYTVE